MKHTLYTRFLFAFVSVVLITLLSVSTPLLLWMRADRTDTLTEELLRQAKDLSFLLEKWHEARRNIGFSSIGAERALTETLNRWLTQVSLEYGSDIIVLSSLGEINSVCVEANLYSPTQNERYDSIFKGYFDEMKRSGDITRRVRTNPPDIILRARPESANKSVLVTGTLTMSAGGEIIGAVIVETSLESFYKTYLFMARQIATTSLLSLCLACLIASFLTLRFTRPLTEISMAADALAKGAFDRRVNIDRNDEIGQLARSFNSMATDLGNLEEMRREFIANVTHELRSPLTSIQGFVEGILDGTITMEESTQYLEIVKGESVRMSRLISELLDLSRMESGQMSLDMATFDINETISRALISFENRIDSKNLTVEVVYRQEPLMVSADQRRIEQVMINLIDNAIKFLGEHGTLKLWTHSAQDKAYITVSDDGPGIEAEDIPFLFDRFYKAEKAHTSGKGTGLGLSIVRSILQQHGQDITVQSRPGQGASFIFTLPLG